MTQEIPENPRYEGDILWRDRLAYDDPLVRVLEMRVRLGRDHADQLRAFYRGALEDATREPPGGLDGVATENGLVVQGSQAKGHLLAWATATLEGAGHLSPRAARKIITSILDNSRRARRTAEAKAKP